MGDFTNKVSKEEFKKITEENGMRIWPRDDKALDFLYEIAKKDDAIDKYLEGLTKKQFWKTKMVCSANTTLFLHE